MRLESENIMDNLDFSEEEIEEQLAALGYKNIPKHRLREFKQDLDELVRHEEWKSLASSPQINSPKSQPSPPAYTKEKVGQCYFDRAGEGFFLHDRQTDHDRQVLTACQNRDYVRQQDSYARHSVALNLRLPAGAPTRLQVEEDPDDTLHPPLSDSYTSTPDSHRGRFIKRKVLRKHKGQSLVCDESFYSEDSDRTPHQERNMYKMYGTQWRAESDDDDKNSLNSSFWSDGERQEEEVERGIGKEDSKRVGNVENSYQEASEEIEKENFKPVGDEEESCKEAAEKEENVRIREEDFECVGDAEDSYQEEEEKIKQVIGKKESTLVGNAEDFLQVPSGENNEEQMREEDSEHFGDAEDSYQETSEEEEEEETERAIGKKESKPVDDAEESYQESSEEDAEVELSEEDSESVGDAEDSLQEISKEVELSEEDSERVGDAEDSLQEISKEVELSEEDSERVGDAEDSLQETSEGENMSEEDSETFGDAEDSYHETSEEEEDQIKRVISNKEPKPVDDAENSYHETSEDEEVEMKQVISEEESKSVGHAEGSLQEASEEKPEPNNQGNICAESFEGGSNDEDDEESCSSSSDSPATSMMTSGYGTYRPEEQEGGDYRDDHTITEFDQDSRGDLSEMRDEGEDDRSLCSFGGFEIDPADAGYIETRPLSVLADAEPEANMGSCGDCDLHEDVDITYMKPKEDKDLEDEEKFEDYLNAVSNDATSEEQHVGTVVKDNLDGKNSKDESDDEGGKHIERLEDVQDLKEEKEVEDNVESDDLDESSSNKDIKFIDSKVDFSRMTYDEMCAEWEGNLRQKKDAASCLEDRLAGLRLSTSAQRDFETEKEDVSGQSDTQSSELEGGSFSAFESYIRGMTRSQSDGDIRPKPKSFIRPVMSQQTIKKTDPVAKYFQYKQLWEMFKLPGETDRRALRSEIKEQLAYQPPAPKPRRVFVPNTYIVPTEKKRSALRWEIRNDLAHGLLPHKFSYRY